MGTATRRRALRQLVAEHRASSQEALRILLARQGHRVSQSTVSRDLEAIGARKVPDESGTEHYALIEEPSAPSPELAAALAGHVLSLAPSGSLVVVHTPPGTANLVALALDRARLPQVLGTIAGDDTVLVIAAEAMRGAALAKVLEHIMEEKG